MSDPRYTLNNQLQKAGIPKDLAFMIALEAGSSQEFVDKQYIRELNVSNEFEQIIFEKVSRFYLGYYNNEEY